MTKNYSLENNQETNNIVRLDRQTINELGIVLENGGGRSAQSDPIAEIRKKGLVRGTFATVGNNIRSVHKGFLESIGAGLGADFGEGLKKALEEDLDFSFKRRGEVVGKTAAFGVTEGGRGLREEFGTLLGLIKKTNVKDTNPKQAAADVDEVRKSLVRLFSLLPTKLATGYRRAAVQLEGLPRVDKLRDRDEHQANDFKNTTKKVIYSYGGFAGREGKAGFDIAEQMREVADESTEIVGMDTGFTDLTVNFRKTTQWVLEALGTVAGINVKGFNPDALKGAAQIVNDLDANPDVKATILGHSAGGFPSEETTQILNLLGYGDRIEGVSAGTPNMKGRLEPPNFTRVMGEGDATMRKFEKGIDPIGLFADDAEILEGVNSHDFKDYLKNERFLEVIFGRRVNSLIERYQKYLEDIAKQASRNAKTKIDTFIPGYKNLTLDQKKTTATEFGKGLKVISNRYRQAVKDNDLNLAKELGENLLKQIQYLRQIYGDILDEGGENRSVSSKLGNLTKIETEVIRGQPNLEAQGLDPKGLVNHLEGQLSGEAGFVVDGFVDGIQKQLDRIKDAGAEIGDSLQDGTDENLGIASPAKKYIKKGIQIVQGFVKGIKDKIADVVAAGKNLGNAVKKGTAGNTVGKRTAGNTVGKRTAGNTVGKRTAGNTVGKGFNAAKQGVDNFFNSLSERLPVLNKFNRILIRLIVKSKIIEFFDLMRERFPIIDRVINRLIKFRRVLFGIAGLLITKIGLDFFVNMLKKVGGESLEAAMSMESLNLSILFASRNALKGAAAIEFISESAKQLSVDLLGAKNQYASLLSAARNTSLEGDQVNRVFNAFAETAANRGLGAGKQQQVFDALKQIINKRYLGREEVVQQLGDVFDGFEGLVSESMGVSSSQLGEMMQNRQLGLDVLPKIAAVLEAQNAAIGSIDTAQKAQTRFNNAVLGSKVALGEALQPLQKFVFNLGTKTIEDFKGKLALLFKLILATGAVSLIMMFGQVNLLTLSTISWKKATESLIFTLKELWAVKSSILNSLWNLTRAYGAVIAIYFIWKNIIDLSKNQYQSIKDDVDDLSASIDRYRAAVDKANDVQSDFGKSQEKGKLKVGWELPNNEFGNFLRPIVGGDNLNFDNLIRNRINWFAEQYGKYQQFVYDIAGQEDLKPFVPKITTESERRQNDFVAENGDLNFATSQLLFESNAAFSSAKKIVDLDAQIAKIQNEREVLLPGDKKALEASLEAERSIAETRDIQLKILTNYQQSLNSAIAANNNALEQLEIGKTRDGFDLDVYEKEKANSLNLRDESVKKLEKINDIISDLTKTLTLYERKLKNSSINLAGFLESRQLRGSQERTEIITEGIELSKSDRTIQLELDESSLRELQDIIAETEKNIIANRARLQSAALNDGLITAKNLAAATGITLDTAGIDELLTKNVTTQVKDALLHLKTILEDEKSLAANKEQLAQSVRSSRTAIKDFNRTVDDYFFNISQQIKEAQIEVLRVINQIVQTDSDILPQ